MAPVVTVLLTLGLGATACGDASATENYVPMGGADASHGTLMVEDVWVDAPHGARAGADTGLRLYVYNGSGHPDALVGVSTPLARRARLVVAGRPARRITIPAHTARDLEWQRAGDGVELDRLTHPVMRGRFYPVTLEFAHSTPVTLQVTAAPLADDPGTRGTAPPG